MDPYANPQLTQMQQKLASQGITLDTSPGVLDQFADWWENNIYNTGRNILFGEDNEVGNVGQGLQNAFYDLTGQTEKTSYYKALTEREDTALQRGAADAMAAGLSKYGMTPGASGSSAGGVAKPQTLSGQVDLAQAIAQIRNVEANTDKTEAEAAATTAGIERDDKYYSLASEKQAADIFRMDLENELTKAYTAETAAKTTAIIQQEARDQAIHILDVIGKEFSNAILKKDLDTYDTKVQADYSLKTSSTYLNYESAKTQSKLVERYQSEIDQSAAYIAHLAAEDLHLSYQDELLMIDYVKAELDVAIKEHDLDFAERYDYPVGFYPSSLFGTMGHLGKGLSNVANSNFEFAKSQYEKTMGSVGKGLKNYWEYVKSMFGGVLGDVFRSR